MALELHLASSRTRAARSGISMALERRKVPDSCSAASGMTAPFLLKIVLDTLRTLSYISPVPSAGGRSREASLGWDGSGACGRRERDLRAREAKANSAALAYLRTTAV